jgi:flavin reductase (DIM6/NTAB) family NADH-FMN oxidoreductase RutF
MEIDVESIPHGLRYNLMVGAIVPRPIAVVGTVNARGQHNLAPFSFFNGVSAEPMVVMFAPVNKRDGTENDSLANAKPVAEGGTGCFSISFATEANIAAVVKCAAELAHGESEFAYAGLTPRACARIAAPALAESPIHFECETIEVRRFAPLGTPNAGNCVFGRVVHVRFDDGLANERMHIDPAKLAAVGRMGGAAYVTTRDRFELARG